jgi:hypothetical protein
MELVCDSAVNPVFPGHMLRKVKQIVGAQNAETLKDQLLSVTEAIVSVAYSGPLARPTCYTDAPIDEHVLRRFHEAVRAPHWYHANIRAVTVFMILEAPR